MSSDGGDMNDGVRRGASQLLARAAAADTRADQRLAVAIDDFLLPEDARLDDRARAALGSVLAIIVATIETALRQHAARLLVSRAEPETAQSLLAPAVPVLDRLTAAGLIRDPELMRELIGRVQQDLLAEALPAVAPDNPETPSLVAGLTSHVDHVVAAGAQGLLAAESRRRSSEDGNAPRTDLPAELHHRLVWWIAAALREAYDGPAGAATLALDRALAEAAQRNLAAHDEGERVEAAAMRLAAAIDPQPAELPALLVEALGDRRLALFIASLAHALGFEYGQAREIVLDPAADRLWLVLRALDLPREAIAKIGLALSEADPRRDIEAFADTIDAIAALPPEDARTALAPLRLHPDYRAALMALARSKRR
jgi:hypothetical protein